VIESGESRGPILQGRRKQVENDYERRGEGEEAGEAGKWSGDRRR